MTKIDDFFIQMNEVDCISDDECRRVTPLIDTIRATSRVVYESLYVIDYYRKNFLYVSDNPLFLCGESPDDVQKSGYSFYLKHIPVQEQEMLVEVNKSGFEFIHQQPAKERLGYTIMYDFHLEACKSKIMVNHKITPLALSPMGNVWLALCMVSLSHNQSVGNIVMRQTSHGDYWEYSLQHHHWEKRVLTPLSYREKEILLFSAQGYTMNEMADALGLTVDTIKFHKKKLFEALDVKNITEALSYAVNCKLI